MRIGEVIGKVTLSKCHPALRGASWRLAVSLTQEGLQGGESGRSEPYVIYDELGAAEGHQIGIAEGAEAAAPFHPDQKPIDAYVAAIFDSIELGLRG